MEISENDATSSQAASGRRKSGRAVKAPEKYATSSQIVNGNSKRKRGAVDDENEENDASDDEESEEEEESADEEELKERTRKARKPVAKKAKVNGKPKVNGTVAHTSAPPMKLPARPKKRGKKVAIADEEAEGLYADIFTSGDSSNDVAAAWVKRFEENNAEALCDLVNALLKAAGCDEKITEHDIEDVDNIPNKLNDISEEYQNHTISEYPLISKAKSVHNFRSALMGFHSALVATIHESGILYTEEALMENITTWVTYMAESKVRPFRHTATVVTVAIVDGLSKASKQQSESTAKTRRLLESEKKKKKGSNKARMAELEQKVEEGKTRNDELETSFKHYWEGVFIHRYRDVDPKIRVECAEGLGSWARVLPELFLEGTYLRYMGWMLSDSYAAVRQEVVKQLEKLFRVQENHGALRHFIERFRARMVQMATRDCEASVRVSTVEMLDAIRDAGMLEPDDIDVIGKLIFDSDAMVRKSVVNFFAENVKESYDAKIDELVEDLGGLEVLESLVVEDEDDVDSPRLSWIKLKSMAELLLAYDSEESEDFPSQIVRGTGSSSDFINASGLESRFSLAAQALFGSQKISVMQEWEAMAAYLLFDKTTTSSRKADSQNKLMLALQLDDKEELILLEVINASVKLTLAAYEESGRSKDKGRKKKADSSESKESTAIHLAALIPRLLSKFGSNPTAAATVLRLEHLLNLSVFQELRQDSTTYASLLDKISSQFTGHEDQKVLNEASAAFLHARSFEDLEDVTEEKVQVLWQDVTDTLRALVQGEADLATRGNLSEEKLIALSNTVRRIHKLASISSCVEVFDSKPRGSKSPKEVITILLEIAARGNLIEPNGETDDFEDGLVSSTIQCLLFYFMWRIRSIKLQSPEDELSQDEIELFTERREEFDSCLIKSLSTRADIDDFRLMATGAYLDFHCLLATVHNDYPELVSIIGLEAQEELTTIFVGMEKQFATKAKKKLEAPEDDEDPEDDEEESEDEQPSQVNDTERQSKILLTEQKLCELTGRLILAIMAKVIDDQEPLKGKLRARLQRNRHRLGANFKNSIAFLDEKKPVQKKSHKSKARQAADAAKKAAKSQEKVVEEEDEDDDPIEDPPEEGTVEDLRRRELLDDDEVEENQSRNGDAEVPAGDADDDEDELMDD